MRSKHDPLYINSAVQTADMESAASHEPLAEKASSRLASLFRVRCHTTGRRIGDCDGRSIKAVLDAFTKVGIWPDDSAEFLAEVSFTQIKTSEEDATYITVFETPELKL